MKSTEKKLVMKKVVEWVDKASTQGTEYGDCIKYLANAIRCLIVDVNNEGGTIPETSKTAVVLDNVALNWNRAEEYLYDKEMEYKSIGQPGLFALSIVIMPLIVRYQEGERTKELYDEIMKVR